MRAAATAALSGASRALRARARCASTVAEAAASAPVAFVGLGQMGSRMARNLAAAGRELVVFDHNAAAVEAFVAEAPAGGGRVEAAPSAAAAAERCGVVVTMLPSSPHVEACYSGPGGVLEASSLPAVALDCSTIAPEAARKAAAAAAARGVAFVDAPVSGGVTGAAAATLTFMAGGDAAHVAAAAPVLGAMGTRTVHCGGAGAGQAAKLANNLALAVEMAGVCEALLLGSRLGVDPEVLVGVFNTSSAQCWSSEKYCPWPGVMDGVPSSNGYAGGFASRLMAKDLGLAAEAAAAEGVATPAADAVRAAYESMAREGSRFADLDFGSMLEYLKELERRGGAGGGR